MRRWLLFFFVSLFLTQCAKEHLLHDTENQPTRETEWEKRAEKLNPASANIHTKYTRILDDLHNGRCESALKALKIKDKTEQQVRLYEAAGLFLAGLCVERDTGLAADLLRQYLDNNPWNPWALARLVDLYWRGDGILQDRTQAKRLFRRAVIALGPRDPHPDEIRLQPHFYWAIPREEMNRRFYHLQVGSWDIPAPLQNELAWLKEAETQGGPKIMGIAEHLLAGTGGFEKDEEAAYYWFQDAVHLYDYIPAAYTYFHLSKRLGKNPKSAFWAFTELALKDDVRTQKEILSILENGDDYPKRDWALYYWMQRLKKNGIPINERRLQEISWKLTADERRILDHWDLGTSASTTPPFTFYHENFKKRGK